jgi:hypothetical protein
MHYLLEIQLSGVKRLDKVKYTAAFFSIYFLYTARFYCGTPELSYQTWSSSKDALFFVFIEEPVRQPVE